jgi:hypothetical protein
MVSLADWKIAMSFEPLTENTWGSITSVNEVDLDNPNPVAIYLQAKTLAEKKIWELAHQNPDVDVTVRESSRSTPAFSFLNTVQLSPQAYSDPSSQTIPLQSINKA